MAEQSLDQSKIKALLSDFYENQNLCGFDVFVVMKIDPKVKRMSLSENKNNDGKTFREVLKDMVFSVIGESYLSDESEYVDGSRLADNQKKLLIINQNGSFTPFVFLENVNSCEVFDISDFNDACGILFKLRKENQTIWCYQHLWSIMVPNKTKNSFMARVAKFERQTVFEEQKDDLLTIAKKIDIIVIDGYLITGNTKLLQTQFGFSDYIYQSAESAIKSITATKLVANSEKLTEYIGRGKPKYAKKMMQIGTSRVLTLSSAELLNKIRTVERWKGKFKIDEKTKQIKISTYTDVESLIDLFDERYTRSDITDTEYDTDVKTIAQPLN